MQSLTLKLKQASAVLGVPPKDLQNLVQMGVIRPARRNSVCWFDTNLLLEAKVAFYLKQTLGSSSDLLARFTEAFSKNLGKAKMGDLGDIRLRSRPLNGTDAVEIKIPLRSLAQELEDQIPRASAYKDLPKGRKRAGWKKDFLRNVQKAAADLGDISEEEILRTVREYRSGRKKPPEITVVARSKKKTAQRRSRYVRPGSGNRRIQVNGDRSQEPKRQSAPGLDRRG
jgi:hypothetical protein